MTKLGWVITSPRDACFAPSGKGTFSNHPDEGLTLAISCSFGQDTELKAHHDDTLLANRTSPSPGNATNRPTWGVCRSPHFKYWCLMGAWVYFIWELLWTWPPVLYIHLKHWIWTDFKQQNTPRNFISAICNAVLFKLETYSLLLHFYNFFFDKVLSFSKNISYLLLLWF